MHNHHLERFVVGFSVAEHVAAAVDSGEGVALEVHQKQKHESFVAQELLQSFERELIKLVVDRNHVLFLLVLAFAKALDHLLGVDQRPQVKY